MFGHTGSVVQLRGFGATSDDQNTEIAALNLNLRTLSSSAAFYQKLSWVLGASLVVLGGVAFWRCARK